MRRRIIIQVVALVISYCSSAQGVTGDGGGIIDALQRTQPGKGTVVINQSMHISQLLNDRLWQNTKNPGMQGFRVRIFLETGQNARSRSNQVMYAFMEKYPGVKVYQDYSNPYWKISVGDFRNKESAQKFYQKLLGEYPKAFLVPDWINFPSYE